jgi:hypothetical protein
VKRSCFASPIRCVILAGFVAGLAFFGSIPAAGQEASPHVTLSVKEATPRSVEDLTEKAVNRDYGFAWRNLSEAFDSASSGPLEGYFVGSARSDLANAVGGEAKSGLRSRYLAQDHHVEAVFYAPEGDAIELHDTMRCQLQILDGQKLVHQEQVELRYVVLMTPAADRWVVRQLQAVPQF